MTLSMSVHHTAALPCVVLSALKVRFSLSYICIVKL